jgi:methylated-DNA-[protein]-cysteine S-methyltransferase
MGRLRGMNTISTPAPEITTTSVLPTPVGSITVEAADRGVRRVSWSDGPDPAADGERPHPVLAAALDQLRDYFAGRRQDFDLPIDLSELSVAQRVVLATLADTVGWGQTITYGELAARSDAGVPARAIGGIMGSNPVPIIIGCHRVVASTGLGGYSGGRPGRGRETKLWLLEHEGALPPSLI